MGLCDCIDYWIVCYYLDYLDYCKVWREDEGFPGYVQGGLRHIMSKKAFSPTVVIPIILGVIVIFSVGALVYTQGGNIAKRIFGEEVMFFGPAEEEQFVPYEAEFTEEEQNVIDSMNALICALNSVAIGEFKPDDPSVCPRGLPGESQESKLKAPPESSLSSVGKAVKGIFNSVTGAAVAEEDSVEFGDVKVTCKGASSKTIFLTHSPQAVDTGSWQGPYSEADYAKKKAVEQIGDTIIDCWENNYRKTSKSYVKCGVLATFPLLGKDPFKPEDSIYVTKQDLLEYFDMLSGFGLHTETIDKLKGGSVRGDRLSISSKLSTNDFKYCREKLGDDETDNVCSRPSRPNYEDAYCVYFDKAGEINAELFGITFGTRGFLGAAGVTRDTILLTDCERNLEAAETFSCLVDNFYLPQKEAEMSYISPAQAWEFAKYTIGATGDPKWLVSYESFPAEATSFWRKNFVSEIVSWRSALVVFGSGALNFGFAKGGQIAGRLGKFIKPGQVVEKAGVKAVAETADAVGRNIAKELAEEGGEVITNRLIANGGDNLVRSLIAEEGLQVLHGVGPQVSRKITDRVLTIVGKSSGEAFEKVEKEVADAVSDIIRKEITDVSQVPEAFVRQVAGPEGIIIGETAPKAIREYQEALAKQVMNNVDLGGQKGLKGLFAGKLSTKAASAVLKRQGMEKFFSNFLKQGGKELNEKLVVETGENTLKQVTLLNRLSKAYTDRMFKMSAGMVDELMRGSFGGKRGVDAAKLMVTSVGEKGILAKTGGVVKGAGWLVWENLPIRLAQPKYWITLTPVGGATASIGKTVANVPAWLAKHRYPMLVLLGVGMMMMDSADEKILPAGGNAIALNTPTAYGESHSFPLHDDTLKYFVRNSEKPGDRLYLVSPCKTQLLIKKTKCECINNPFADKFNFGNTGLINVKKGSVVPKDEATLRAMIEEEYKDFVKWSAAELEVKAQDPGFSSEYQTDNLWFYWQIKLFMEAYKKVIDEGKSKQEAIAFAKDVEKKEIENVFNYEDAPKGELLEKELIDELIKNYELFKSVDDVLMEYIIEYKLIQIKGVFDSLVQSRSLGTSEEIKAKFFGFGGVERTMDTSYRYFAPYEKYFDTTNLIKECGSRGLVDSGFGIIKHAASWWGVVLGERIEQIKEGEIFVSPEKAKHMVYTAGSKISRGNNYFNAPSFHVGCLEAEPYGTQFYCYDDYPAQEMAKTAVHVTALIIDVVISVGSGGTAAPAVFFLTGAAAGAADVLISATEFWPLSTRWASQLGQAFMDIRPLT